MIIFRFSLAIVLLATVLVSPLRGGTWTVNEFLYKPEVGARGTLEKGNFDSGMDRIDARLGKEIWVGDPKYGTSLQEAVTAIATTPATLNVPPGTHVGGGVTIPATLALKVHKGATITVATGLTFTVNGDLDAGVYQIFSLTGTGQVVFGAGAVKEILVDWFGSNGAAVNAAIQATNNLGGIVRFTNKAIDTSDATIVVDKSRVHFIGAKGMNPTYVQGNTTIYSTANPVWLTKQAYNPTWQYLDFLGDGTNDCLKARNDADGQGAQADFVFESCSFNKFNRALVAGTLAADGVNTPVYNWKVQNSWMNGCVEYARIDAPAADGMEFYNVSMTDQLGVSDYMFYTSASASGELILINVKGSFYNTYAHVGTAFIKMAAGFGLTAINTRCEGSPTGWKWLDTANSPGNKPVTLINCQGIVIPDSGDYITCGITEGLNIIGGKFKGQINTTGNCIPSVVGADIASAIFIGNSTSAAYVNVPASYGIAQQPGISYGGYPIGQYAFESRSRGAMIGGDIISAKPTVLGSETLTNPNLTGGASWTATNDCTLAADAATWAYSAGTASTLTQASGALAVAAQGNRQYLFTYVVSNVIPSTSGSIRPTASITTAFGAFTVPLQIVAGSQSLIFKCAASPGDFVITSTLLAGQAFTLDTFSLKEITGGNVVAAGKFTGGGGYGLKIDKDGNAVFDGKIKATLSVYANNAAAIAGGLVAGQLYRTGADPDQVCIVH